MRTFVLRARAAPTDGKQLLAGVGTQAHTEILAHTLMNAIFIAQCIAPTSWSSGAGKYADFSRTIRFEATPCTSSMASIACAAAKGAKARTRPSHWQGADRPWNRA